VLLWRDNIIGGSEFVPRHCVTPFTGVSQSDEKRKCVTKLQWDRSQRIGS
jgi:hypothetical protein